MGKEFTAIMGDGSERFAASMSMGRSRDFYETAKALEFKVGMPCGMTDDQGMDEHHIDPAQFIAFCERIETMGIVASQQSDIHEWARYATGMIENITLTERTSKCADGSPILTQRYMRPEEFSP